MCGPALGKSCGFVVVPPLASPVDLWWFRPWQVQDLSELALTVAAAWTAMNFKTRVIAWQARCIQLDK